MARIQQLSPLVIAQIAAGEVIERPASVAKELLENAVDAGASRIDVEVGGGGIEWVRVVDNGGGMHPDDLPLAFASHATSKLRCADDLLHIGTLGFRGEGLASIGGIAQVTLQSRLPDQPHGCEVQCNGGVLSPVRVWNGAPGTRIEVRHLFYNVPVRKKFLRGPAAEFGHVEEVFIRLALSQLSLHLTLKHNSKLLHDVPSTAGLLDRIGLFFGKELRDKLLMVEAEQGRMTLTGYVADPVCERGGTSMQYLFINGRCIRDRALSQALAEAYRGLQMTHRHPVAFLFLDLPPEEVDVNVHPTKAEVRFRRPEKVQQLVQNTVRARLQGEDLTAPLRVREAPPRTREPERPAPELPFATVAHPLAAPTPADVPPVRQPVSPARGAPAAKPAGTPAPAPLATPSVPRHHAPPPTPAPGPQRPVAPAPSTGNGAPVKSPAAGAPTLAPGAGGRAFKAVQMHDLYLVVEVPEGMLVIDQHALHERILFEQLKERLAQGRLESQKLLIPEPVSLSPAQAALVLEHREALGELGLEVDDFGRGTVLLGGYPALLGKRRPREILTGVVEYLQSKERPPTREALLNDLLSLVACHAAVRAGDRLSAEEISELAARRDLARDSHHCPHGRPTSLLFTRAELDRQFRRT